MNDGIMWFLVIMALIFGLVIGFAIQKSIDQDVAVAHKAAYYSPNANKSGVEFKWNDEGVK
jgi:hypothetical protein